MSSSLVTILWTQSEASCVDSKGVRHFAPNLIALADAMQIRDAIVLVAHRHTILRVSKIPNLKRRQLDPMVKGKVSTLFPAGTQSFSFGYRIGNQPNGAGAVAIIGGVKSDTVRKIYADAAKAGMRVGAVLPSVFGSWSAANEKHLRNCVVVGREGSDVYLDVISDGELLYSRFTQIDEETELQEEIESTLKSSGVFESKILTLGDMSLPDSISDPREGSAFTNDLGLIKHQLFSIELPEQTARRERRKALVAAKRGVSLAVAAVIAWGVVLALHQENDARITRQTSLETALAQGEKQKVAQVQREVTGMKQKEHLVNLAFDPPQSFMDMINVFATDSDRQIWLTGLDLKRGGAVSVRGDAKDQKSISEFVRKLRGEPRFRDVELRFITTGQWNNLPIYQFAVSAWPIGNLPFDQYVASVNP